MDWGQLALAVLGSGAVVAAINAFANRHSVTADVYESISKSAATLSEASEKRINRLYERVQELEEREKTQIQELTILRSEIHQLRGEVSGKDAKIADLKNLVDELRKELTGKETKIAMLKKELVTREEEIESLRKRVTSLEADLYGRQSYNPPHYQDEE